jgi:Ca2+:H+ antiporter
VSYHEHISDLTRLLILGAVETVIFAVSVLVVTGTVQDGKSNYLEGAMVSLSCPGLL